MMISIKFWSGFKTVCNITARLMCYLWRYVGGKKILERNCTTITFQGNNFRVLLDLVFFADKFKTKKKRLKIFVVVKL